MPRAADAFLGDSIKDVVHNNASHVKPMIRYSAVKGGWSNWPGGRQALTNTGVNYPPAVSDLNINRLLTVLSCRATLSAANAVDQAIGTTTVRQFREMNSSQQITFIDSLWEASTSRHPFNTAARDMYDPGGGQPQNGNAPIPTSWQPDNTKRLSGTPWKKYCIGFRVDGSDQSSINRVLTNGMTQQRLSIPFMRNYRGLEITHTAAAVRTYARCWTMNNDIFNESAVCVSRNFFGATAFPERGTTHGSGEVCYLWAVDCSGMNGFDTEQYQLNIGGGSRNWRPGEKAFREIPVNRLLGYIPVKRHGVGDQNGWSFSIDKNTDWKLIHKEIDYRKRDYINGELKAWRGRVHHIPTSQDFANN